MAGVGGASGRINHGADLAPVRSLVRLMRRRGAAVKLGRANELKLIRLGLLCAELAKFAVRHIGHLLRPSRSRTVPEDAAPFQPSIRRDRPSARAANKQAGERQGTLEQSADGPTSGFCPPVGP